MSKRKKPTSEKELHDAIDRMSKKPEASNASGDSKIWKNYLLETLGIHENALSSEKGQEFWGNVRTGVNDKQQQEQNRPTERQQAEFNTRQVIVGGKIAYRNNETGRFVSKYDIMGIPRPPQPETRTVTFASGRTVTFHTKKT